MTFPLQNFSNLKDKRKFLPTPNAMTSLTKEKVHNVTLNTIKFDSLIHPSIHRLDDYDQKTYLSVRIHIIENEKC